MLTLNDLPEGWKVDGGLRNGRDLMFFDATGKGFRIAIDANAPGKTIEYYSKGKQWVMVQPWENKDEAINFVVTCILTGVWKDWK
jgi:hypothetical protein